MGNLLTCLLYFLLTNLFQKDGETREVRMLGSKQKIVKKCHFYYAGHDLMSDTGP